MPGGEGAVAVHVPEEEGEVFVGGVAGGAAMPTSAFTRPHKNEFETSRAVRRGAGGSEYSLFNGHSDVFRST